MTLWQPPPDGTDWVLDWQDEHQLVGSVTIADIDAPGITEWMMSYTHATHPNDLLRRPYRVGQALARLLRDYVPETIDLDAWEYYLSVFQKPMATDGE